MADQDFHITGKRIRKHNGTFSRHRYNQLNQQTSTNTQTDNLSAIECSSPVGNSSTPQSNNNLGFQPAPFSSEDTYKQSQSYALANHNTYNTENTFSLKGMNRNNSSKQKASSSGILSSEFGIKWLSSYSGHTKSCRRSSDITGWNSSTNSGIMTNRNGHRISGDGLFKSTPNFYNKNSKGAARNKQQNREKDGKISGDTNILIEIPHDQQNRQSVLMTKTNLQQKTKTLVVPEKNYNAKVRNSNSSIAGSSLMNSNNNFDWKAVRRPAGSIKNDQCQYIQSEMATKNKRTVNAEEFLARNESHKSEKEESKGSNEYNKKLMSSHDNRPPENSYSHDIDNNAILIGTDNRYKDTRTAIISLMSIESETLKSSSDDPISFAGPSAEQASFPKDKPDPSAEKASFPKDNPYNMKRSRINQQTDAMCDLRVITTNKDMNETIATDLKSMFESNSSPISKHNHTLNKFHNYKQSAHQNIKADTSYHLNNYSQDGKVLQNESHEMKMLGNHESCTGDKPRRVNKAAEQKVSEWIILRDYKTTKRGGYGDKYNLWTPKTNAMNINVHKVTINQNQNRFDKVSNEFGRNEIDSDVLTKINTRKDTETFDQVNISDVSETHSRSNYKNKLRNLDHILHVHSPWEERQNVDTKKQPYYKSKRQSNDQRNQTSIKPSYTSMILMNQQSENTINGESKPRGGFYENDTQLNQNFNDSSTIKRPSSNVIYTRPVSSEMAQRSSCVPTPKNIKDSLMKKWRSHENISNLESRPQSRSKLFSFQNNFRSITGNIPFESGLPFLQNYNRRNGRRIRIGSAGETSFRTLGNLSILQKEQRSPNRDRNFITDPKSLFSDIRGRIIDLNNCRPKSSPFGETNRSFTTPFSKQDNHFNNTFGKTINSDQNKIEDSINCKYNENRQSKKADVLGEANGQNTSSDLKQDMLDYFWSYQVMNRQLLGKEDTFDENVSQIDEKKSIKSKLSEETESSRVKQPQKFQSPSLIDRNKDESISNQGKQSNEKESSRLSPMLNGKSANSKTSHLVLNLRGNFKKLENHQDRESKSKSTLPCQSDFGESFSQEDKRAKVMQLVVKMPDMATGIGE